MKAPTIKVGTKIYSVRPGAKVWRAFLELQQSENTQDSLEGLNELYEFYAVSFGGQLTPEEIEDNLEIGRLYGLLMEIGKWITHTMQQNTKELPKNAKRE